MNGPDITNRRRMLLAGFWAVGLWLACTVTLSACPFCNVTTTLTERIDDAVEAYVVEWSSGTEGIADRVDPGTTRVRVTHVLRAGVPERAPGDEIELDAFTPGRVGERFLLFGVSGDEGKRRWEGLLACSDALLEYLQQRPPADRPNTERLSYFVRFLEHPDETIAVDAYGEFARCSYQEVAALAGVLPRRKLHEWVKTPAPETGRIGRVAFYGMLLGLCGTGEDAAMLERRILSPGDDFRIEIGGLMAGYLRLRGDAGLEVLERHVLTAEAPMSEAFAFQEAVRFEWDFGNGSISRERLRGALRPLIDDPRFAALIITDLTRWEDLAIVDQLATLSHSPEFEDFEIQKAIATYYLTMAQLNPQGRGVLQQHAIALAGRHLAELRARDPELVLFAERRLPAMLAQAESAPGTPPTTNAPTLAIPAGTRAPPTLESDRKWSVRWVFYPALFAAIALFLRRTRHKQAE